MPSSKNKNAKGKQESTCVKQFFNQDANETKILSFSRNK